MSFINSLNHKKLILCKWTSVFFPLKELHTAFDELLYSQDIKTLILKNNFNSSEFRSFYSKPSEFSRVNYNWLFLAIRPVLKMLIDAWGLKIWSQPSSLEMLSLSATRTFLMFSFFPSLRELRFGWYCQLFLEVIQLH